MMALGLKRHMSHGVGSKNLPPMTTVAATVFDDSMSHGVGSTNLSQMKTVAATVFDDHFWHDFLVPPRLWA